MSDRPLTASEKALWQKFIETVEPLSQARVIRTETADHKKPLIKPPVRVERSRDMPAAKKTSPDFARHERGKEKARGLDGHWDRRLTKGAVRPDVTVDLHGHSLSSAHGRLDSALELSIAAGHRTVLLITGKARSDDERSREGGRGAIRAAISDWLAASRHAQYIATVRRAHPRHGGAGALYIILRRRQ